MDDKDLRREAFSALFKEYVAKIETHVKKLFGSVESKAALQYQRQLMIYVGMISFGKRGARRSLGGSCFWCFPIFTCLIWLARRWNRTKSEGGFREDHHPANHYIDWIEDAFRKAEKAKQLAAEKKAKANKS